MFGQILQDISALAVANDRSGWNQDDKVFPLGAVLQGRAAGTAFIGFPKALMNQRRKVIGIRIGSKDDGAAVAAVAAVRPALGNIFFATETTHSLTAVAGLDKDIDAINEHVPPVFELDASTSIIRDL